jgi:type I restriction enzyme M protein
MIWASRYFLKANPQNLLRPSDLMRILVPWRAFGDLAKTYELVAVHEQKLLHEQETERKCRFQDIEDAYARILEPLEGSTAELTRLESQDWMDAGFSKKADYSARIRDLKRNTKAFYKIKAEREKAEAEVDENAERELAHIREAAADLLRICSIPSEAARHFSVTDLADIEQNEFNLNLPRYVDTSEPEELIDLSTALQAAEAAKQEADAALKTLKDLVAKVDGSGGALQ